MKKIGDLTTTANQAGEFQEGSSAGGIMPTLLKADWFNGVQREIVAVLTAAEIAQDQAQDDQLQQAIKKLASAAATAAQPGKATDDDFSTGTDDAKFTTVKKIKTWIGTVLKQATENTFGWAKVATQTQTNSGADDTTMVTPKKLSVAISAWIIQATETIRGIVKLATSADTITGTDTQTAVTPAGLAIARPALGQAKAWVSFDGTGTVAIKDAYNVSSITDRGTGQYTINLAIAMANTNFVALANHTNLSGSFNTQKTEVFGTTGNTSVTPNSFSINTIANGSYYDPAIVNCAIFGRT